jgi:mRNA degradation ribonuclease J1/J2
MTHCHLDHIGSLPLAMREFPNTPVHHDASSRMLIERMLHNSANVMLRQKEDEEHPGLSALHPRGDRPLAKRSYS